MNRNQRLTIAKTALQRLKVKYKSEMETSLEHSNPWELLVSTMLSAQSQDVHINRVTPALFKAFKTPKDYTKLRPTQLYKYLKSVNLYKGKSRNVVNSAKMITKDFGGKVPKTMEELILLPGVGRKTANVVLANAFGENHGMAIDTHCITVTNRLFKVNTKDAARIEQLMIEIVPRKDWNNFSHLLIALGRDVCTARTKYCANCVLNDICPSSTVK
jgi:endonuclease III